MINRTLIRIKVVQMVYSHVIKKTTDLPTIEKEFLYSLEKSYQLYYQLLLLMIAITDLQRARIEMARNKHLPTPQEKKPNTRFVDNTFIALLRQNTQLQAYVEEQKISWANEQETLRLLLDKILASPRYQAYMESEAVTFADDKELWRALFKHLLVSDEHLNDSLESQSLYWNDDLSIISTFVIKTIKKLDPDKGDDQALLPMFKDDQDKEYALSLLRNAVMNEESNHELINEHTKNWEIERIALMDVIIMQVALAELHTFTSIPVEVTLNEYIEIAKSYSTPKSGHFVNGILDAIFSKDKKKITQ